MKTSRKKTKQAFANIQKENEAFQAKFTELEDKTLCIEACSRRENLKFENIVEEYDGFFLYAKTKKKQTKKREIDLQQIIAKLEEEADKRNLDDAQTSHIEEEIYELKRELEKIIEERTKGAILKSKTKCYNEGEDNTKYFLKTEATNKAQ